MKDIIYIGETFLESIPPKSKLVVGNKNITVLTIENTTNDTVMKSVDTTLWTAGIFSTVLNVNGAISIGQVQVIDPLESTTALQDALDQIAEIDKIIADRARNAVTQITINNKTIIHMSINELSALRAMYVKRANKLRGSSGIFKSITLFRGK
jgi:hypothetical protein